MTDFGSYVKSVYGQQKLRVKTVNDIWPGMAPDIRKQAIMRDARLITHEEINKRVAELITLWETCDG